MYKKAVFSAYFKGNLSNGLKKGLRLDVAYGAADLGDNNICIGLFSYAVNEFLYLVGDVGNYLNGGTEIFTSALLVEHVPVHLSGGEIGKTVKILVDKTLVMSEVKVGFCSVLGDINFTVLIGAHSAGINVYVGVKLLSCHFKSSRL